MEPVVPLPSPVLCNFDRLLLLRQRDDPLPNRTFVHPFEGKVPEWTARFLLFGLLNGRDVLGVAFVGVAALEDDRSPFDEVREFLRDSLTATFSFSLLNPFGV